MNAAARKPDHVYLVDGSGYIFRAFHALPPLTRSDGTPVNAVLGFCNMLLKLIEDAEAEYIAVIFDAGRKTFRNEIYAEYKAHRPEAPPELVPQFALIREATRAFNVPAIEIQGYEADDLIATYATQAAAQGHDVTIVSSDKDLMQLVGDRISLFDPMKNRKIGETEVLEKFGVAPDKVVDVQSLAGDSSDNVPGVPGIGVKTAAELINTYGDLDTLLARAGEIKQPKRRENLLANADLARISRDLVTLKRDVPLDVPLDGLAKQGIDGATALAFLQQNEFRQLITKLQARLGEAGIKASRGGARTENAKSGDATVQIAADPAAFSGTHELVQDEERLVAWITRARAAGAIAFDIETTSLNIIEAKLVGMSLAVAANAACYVPVGHEGKSGDLLGGATERPQQIPLDRALALMKPLLEDPSVLKIGHNIKYDLAVMRRYGIETAPIDDSMLISYVLEGGAHGHGMDELAKLHFDHDTIKFGDVAGSGKSQVTFDQVPLDKALAYAGEDADVTWRLHNLLKPRLIAERLTTVYETIERPLVPVIAGMELAGVKIDAAELGRMSQDFASRMADMEGEIHDLAGAEFNVGSPKQLGEILFDRLKLPGGKKGKTGAYSTGADVLEELAETSGHPLPQKVLDWRQLAKLKSTYTDALPLAIRPETGRVHTSFALAHTSTGRIASTDPNLQNIPIRTEEGRKIRRAFVAEPGHVLLSVDYSQIELRLAAEMADIQGLKDAFRDGADIHAMTASQVFGVPVEGMDPMVRRQAKAINFGIIYGISAFGLAQQLGIPQGEAKAYIEAYFERYPGIRDYMERMKKFAREKGYVETLFGRRCHMPGINDKNPARRSFMERAAINAPLQGTAADIIKRAMIRMPGALQDAGLNGRMLLQVHDELLFEVPEAEAEATGKLVKKVMEEAPLPARKISVPLIAEIGTGPNWAEAH
ncbi:DNA polymerase I [Dongia mobilis]|uniref:DNA polymerase I n=1 Tax=Dongia mobilis TaxID=578943 RepID=A0A4R6WIZ3_9PROT|nr:DNA polymerase I [Dongia mobilis]TDQ78773.1 DNA polymerase I [Dongia mobilis]